MEIIRQKDFEKTIEKGLVIVDFFVTWCAPCRMMGMILEEVEEECGGDVKIVKIDVDNDEKLARSYGIMSIPTLIFFKDGKELDKHIGLMQKDRIIDFIKENKG